MSGGNMAQLDLRFDGATYNPQVDQGRLGRQLKAVKDLMLDGQWRTLGEIEEILRFPQASISARLRDLRKFRCGSYAVLRRRRGNIYAGIFEYSVQPRANG